MMRSSWIYGLLALPPIPILLFSNQLPIWASIAALVWLLALFMIHSANTKTWFGKTPADFILLLLLLLLPASLWVTTNRDITLARSFALIANIALFYAIAIQSGAKVIRWGGWALLLGGLILTIVTIPGTRFFTGEKLPLIKRSVVDLFALGWRLPGDENGFNPNITGAILAWFFPPALVLSIRPTGRWQRILAIVTMLVLVLAVLLTQSRGAIIALVVGLAVTTGLIWRKLGWVWLASGVVALVALLLKGDSILNALFTTNTSNGDVVSMSARIELWSRAIYAGVDFPFTGIGLGQFPDTVQKLYPPTRLVLSEQIPHAHNFYLQTLAEMGYPGLIVHSSFIMILIFVLVQHIRHKQQHARHLAIGLLGTLAVFLTHGIVEAPNDSPLSAIVLWGLFGTMMAVGLSNVHIYQEDIHD